VCYVHKVLPALVHRTLSRHHRRPATPSQMRVCAGRGSRVLAALAALAFVLSSWFGLVHESTTTHVRCAQHGEVIDSAVSIARINTPDAPRDPAGAQVDEGGASWRGGHEHCALASAMRESRITPPPPVVTAALAVTAHTVSIAADRVITRDRGLYRTAPKTSPPA
jgi:hypothetical protein